jgi:hypothetical protein
MTTHGTAIPAKTITAYCAECKDDRECYDFGKDGKYCCNCLRAVGEGKKPKSAEKKQVLSAGAQGVLF